MVDIWLDVATPKDALLASCLLTLLHEKSYNVLVTAREQTQTIRILKLLNVPHHQIGSYGETLREKLLEEQRRIREFIEFFDKIGLPRVLWTHGEVGAIRTAFGLQVPIVYSNDTLHAIHVAKLATPLVDWIVAPSAFGKSWTRFGIPKNRIILYDGVEETAWIKDVKFKIPAPKKAEDFAESEKVILFRNVEYKASYYRDIKVDTCKLIEKLSKMAKIVYLPRYEEEREKFAQYENVWLPKKPLLAYQLLPFVDLVIGSGGTVCRESALMGIPTISFHFWDVIAKYLNRKGFPIRILTELDKIVSLAKRSLRNPDKYKKNTSSLLEQLESPISVTIQFLEKSLK